MIEPKTAVVAGFDPAEPGFEPGVAAIEAKMAVVARTLEVAVGDSLMEVVAVAAETWEAAAVGS